MNPAAIVVVDANGKGNGNNGTANGNNGGNGGGLGGFISRAATPLFSTPIRTRMGSFRGTPQGGGNSTKKVHLRKFC